MTRRLFSLLVPLLPTALLAKQGVTIELKGLDPRFVEQLKVAARSRNESVEAWIVEVTTLYSGYHLSDGFAK